MTSEHPTKPPHNDWRKTVLLFALTGLIESLAWGHLSAFTPLFLEELHVAPRDIPTWTGILSALGFVFGLPLIPFWGVFADRYGRKLIIIRSSVVAALLFACTGASTSVWMMAVAKLLAGFVFGNTGVMMTVQSEITPHKRLGTAIAIISAGSPVGMAVGPYFGGRFADVFGIRSLLYLDAILTLFMVLALILFLKEEDRPPTQDKNAWEGVVNTFRTILHTASVLRYFIATFFISLGMSAVFPFIPLLIEHLYHGPSTNRATIIGQVATIAGVTMALTTPLWGQVGDRFGHLRIWRLCSAAVAVTLVGQGLALSLWQVGVLRATMGLFQGGVGALGMALLATYSPRGRRSAILPLSLLPQQLSWFMGSLIGSYFAKLNLYAPFWAGACLMGVGLIFSFRLHTIQPGEEEMQTK